MQLAREGFFVYAGCLDGNGVGAKYIKNVENTLVLQMDVTKEEEINQALEVVESHLDGKELWAVVANAGVAHLGYIEWQP
nr:estradiol 17-beta-dehydrogenase 2-like [Rhipicephalus microplus]